MLKEIFEQPAVIAETLEGASTRAVCSRRASATRPRRCSTERGAWHIIACGTS